MMLFWASPALHITPASHARATHGSPFLLPSCSPGTPALSLGITQRGRSSSKRGQPGPAGLWGCAQDGVGLSQAPAMLPKTSAPASGWDGDPPAQAGGGERLGRT